MKQTHIWAIGCCIALWCSYSDHALAKSKRDPSPRQANRRDDISYTNCRNKVLADFKAKAKSDKQLKLDLKQCLVQYPTAAVYVDCKAKLISLYKADPKQAREKLRTCHELSAGVSYDPNQPVPYQMQNDRHYFAGADLSFEAKFRVLDSLPNFACEHLHNVLEGLDDPDFLLFGNTPTLFPALAKIPTKDLLKTLNAKVVKRDDETYVTIPYLGRIYGVSSKNASLYFPSSYCYFKAKLGPNFADHKLYFLLDQKAKRVVPYFGASFFVATQTTWTAVQVKDALLAKLGNGFKAQKLSSGAYFFAKDLATEFDEEGDPKNLCRAPRNQQIVGILRLKGNKPYAVMVANMRNVCTFGDQLADSLILK